MTVEQCWRLRNFCVLGKLKMRMVAPSHKNHTGTTCGRPSGRVEWSQITGSVRRRWSIDASSFRLKSTIHCPRLLLLLLQKHVSSIYVPYAQIKTMGLIISYCNL